MSIRLQTLSNHCLFVNSLLFDLHILDDVGEPQDPIVEYHDKFRRGDLNMDDKLDETEFLYFEHPEHNPQSIKDLVEDMIQNFDKNQDKVSFNFIYFLFLISLFFQLASLNECIMPVSFTHNIAVLAVHY